MFVQIIFNCEARSGTSLDSNSNNRESKKHFLNVSRFSAITCTVAFLYMGSGVIPLERLSNPVLLFVAEVTDNASVSFVKCKGDYYVSTETNFMHKVNPESLETLEKVVL